MIKNNKKDLQNRREFFKSAAKAALPIIGAAVLASAPAVTQAAEKAFCPNSCYQSCIGGCSGNCKGECYASCKGTCENQNMF